MVIKMAGKNRSAGKEGHAKTANTANKMHPFLRINSSLQINKSKPMAGV